MCFFKSWLKRFLKTSDVETRDQQRIRLLLDELKQTQIQLVHAEKMSTLGTLTAGIIHEIKNPINFTVNSLHPLERNLNSLLTAFNALANLDQTQSLEERTTAIKKIKTDLELTILKNEMQNSLDGMREGLKRTVAIIQDLGKFSRVDGNKMQLVNIHECLDSTLNILSNALDKQITIIKEYHAIPEIICYEGKLNQVFMNMLSNAAAAIKDKGEIRIRTESRDNTLLIFFIDNGKGIQKDNIKKIFTPFFTTQENGKGMGLGLSVSSDIIREHRGTITVKSDSGKGSEFLITLPVRQI